MPTVPTEVSEQSFTGNGVTVDFPLSFPILATSHLVVELTPDGESVPVLQIEGVDYTVDDAPSDAPTVTMTAAPADGDTLHVYRELPVVQPINLLTQGPFSPATHTRELDRRTMVEQMLLRRLEALEALADLTPQSAADGQLTSLAFTADAVDIEDTFPLTLTPAVAVGQTIAGVQVVGIEVTSGVDTSAEPVTVREWGWVDPVLTLSRITGLTPGVGYILTFFLHTRDI